MINRFLITIYFIVLVQACAKAQTVNRDSLLALQPIKRIYKTNPAAILIGPYLISSEYKLKTEIVTDKQHSWECSFSYLDKNILFHFFDLLLMPTSTVPSNVSFMAKGFKAELSARYYPYLGIGKYSGIAPHGFFIAPHTTYSTLIYSTRSLYNSGNYYRNSKFSVNLISGIQFVFYKFLTLEFYGGLGVKQVKFFITKNHQTTEGDPENALVIPGRFNMVLGGTIGFPIYRKF